MKTYETLKSMNKIECFINENRLAFLYISRPNCSVCHGLLPQVQHVLANYPNIKMGHINVDEIKEVAGRFSVFTVPVLLFFVDNKEYIREARIVHMDRLAEKIGHLYKHVVDP